MRSVMRIHLALLVLGVALASCGDMDLTASGGQDRDWGDGPGNEDAAPHADVQDDLDEEPEVRREVRPVASQRYVYVANEEARMVARVDALTLAVRPIPLDVPPHVVLASAQSDRAVVLSRGAERLFVIRSLPDRDVVTPLPTVRGNNALMLSESGRWGVAWYDNAASMPGEPVGSFQELTLIDVEEERAYVLSTGFGIRQVGFSADESRFHVVTESGIHLVQPASITSNAALPITQVALASVGERPEVMVAPDASVALIRDPSLARLVRVDLRNGAVGDVVLSEIAGQLLALPNGREVVVAQPEGRTLAVVDFEVSGAPVRSIGMPLTVSRVALDTESGDLLGWHPGDAVSAWVRLPASDLGSPEVFRLRSPATSVVPLSGQGRALVVHAQSSANAAMTVFDLASGYGKYVRLGATPRQVVAADGGAAAWIRLEGSGRDARSLHRIDLNTFARLEVPFDAVPETFGLMPGGEQLYVSLADDQGRLAFVDTVEGGYRQVAGYLLNAFIE